MASPFRVVNTVADTEDQKPNCRVVYGVSIATVEGTERNDAQWLSDALKGIGVEHETRTVNEQEMATMAPNFERG